MNQRFQIVAVTAMLAIAIALPCRAVDSANDEPAADKWVTVTGKAAGETDKARDEAVARALRTAVEEACGVFLTAESKTLNYQAVYDKVFADAVGYVKEYKVGNVTVADGVTTVKVRACVSTQEFEKNWASIRHTVNQENNPRVIIAIEESVHHGTRGQTYETQENGIVQGKVEDFFLGKEIVLVDKTTATDVSKRDILLAAIKDDTNEVAALGARFKADVVLTGKAAVKFGKELHIADQTMYQYTGTVNVRVVQTDSARVLASKSFGPVTVNTLQRGGGEDKVLTKLGEDVAPKLLAAVVEAWRKRANVSRTVQLNIAGMDYERWKAFREEVAELPGVQAARLREITEATANIDLEYEYDNESLADKLTELSSAELEVLEITANRIKLKVK